MNRVEAQGQRIVWRNRNQTLRVEPWALVPAGAEWSDAWTGAKLAGGHRRVVAAPLDCVPVFLRDDAGIGKVFARG
jgi:hypothetical protein